MSPFDEILGFDVKAPSRFFCFLTAAQNYFSISITGNLPFTFLFK